MIISKLLNMIEWPHLAELQCLLQDMTEKFHKHEHTKAEMQKTLCL